LNYILMFSSYKDAEQPLILPTNQNYELSRTHNSEMLYGEIFYRKIGMV